MEGRETQSVTIEPRTVIWGVAKVCGRDSDGVKGFAAIGKIRPVTEPAYG